MKELHIKPYDESWGFRFLEIRFSLLEWAAEASMPSHPETIKSASTSPMRLVLENSWAV
jgi:hypothetical protein